MMKFSDVKIGQRFAYMFDQKNDNEYYWEFIKVDECNQKTVKVPESRKDDYQTFGPGNNVFNVVVLDDKQHVVEDKNLMRLEVKYMKDGSFHGYMNGTYFKLWRSQEEMELFRMGWICMCTALHYDYESYESWE
jgi:hypothetical protein